MNETEAKAQKDEDPRTAKDAAPGEAKPALEAMEGGMRDEAPEGFEEKIAEENREYANIYRQNLLSQTAEFIRGLGMMHSMAAHGNKEARETMNVFWGILRTAGVAFPTNRKQRRRLKALPTPPKEDDNGGKLPA
jgi:hypothetical protein